MDQTSEAKAEPASGLARMAQLQTTLWPALLGSLLCWLALPPVGWSYLAWVAPVPYLLLVSKPELPGRRPYRSLWLAGMVYWLLAAHWIRLPHPANYIAWFALATYLGVYLPTFVALSRTGVHRLRLPLALVAPVVWVGLDWLRGWLLTGFSMCSLCHSQANNLWVIQIADLGGEYLVSFVILFVAAALCTALIVLTETRAAAKSPIKCLIPLGFAVVTLVLVLLYGELATTFNVVKTNRNSRTTKIALIQGNTPADWKRDPQRQRNIMEEYTALSGEAVDKNQDIDLVIWPETAFREALITIEPGYTPPAELLPPERIAAATDYLKLLTERLGSALLVGIDRIQVFADAEKQMQYRGQNSSIMIDTAGNNLGTYDKMHLVPFGEYIPLAKWFPLLYRITPVAGGAEPGESPTGMLLGDVLYVPNICYESAVPRLIRQQVNTVAEELGRRPDVLVNLTNDAWYWGSSELDLHLACSVFRAVEMRLPHVIAANGGLSAVVNARGEVEQVTPRQETAFLIADIQLAPSQATLYSRWGDWLALPCVLCCVVLAAIQISTKHKK